MATYEERGFGLVQNAVIGTIMSLANEVGIFQVLCNADSPLTSNDVALVGGLKERFVREVLGCLSTADMVQVSERDDGQLQYSLDDEAKKALNGQLAAFLGFPGAMAGIFSSIKDCFYKDGPACVRYTDQLQNILDKFSQVNAPETSRLLVEHVPDLGLKAQLEEGIDVFECGSGKARLSATLAQQYPNSRFVASDVIPDLVASNKMNWKNIPNLFFSVDDICSVPEMPKKQFDWVFCCDVIHDLPDPLEALQGIKRMLRKPSGLLSFIDMATTGSPLSDKGNTSVAMYYGLGTFFCIPESFQRANSAALGPCSGRQTMCDLVRKAGFELKDVMIDQSSALFICQLPPQS